VQPLITNGGPYNLSGASKEYQEFTIPVSVSGTAQTIAVNYFWEFKTTYLCESCLISIGIKFVFPGGSFSLVIGDPFSEYNPNVIIKGDRFDFTPYSADSYPSEIKLRISKSVNRVEYVTVYNINMWGYYV